MKADKEDQKTGNRVLRLMAAASRLVSSSSGMFQLVKETTVKIAKEKKRLKEVAKDLELMVSLIRAFIKGEYQDVSRKSLVLIVAGCLYFLNPLDVVPDFLLVGLVDDVQILIFVLGLVKNELEKFKHYQERRSESADASSFSSPPSAPSTSGPSTLTLGAEDS